MEICTLLMVSGRGRDEGCRKISTERLNQYKGGRRKKKNTHSFQESSVLFWEAFPYMSNVSLLCNLIVKLYFSFENNYGKGNANSSEKFLLKDLQIENTLLFCFVFFFPKFCSLEEVKCCKFHPPSTTDKDIHTKGIKMEQTNFLRDDFLFVISLICP